MRATELRHNLGQSLWLDNITHDLLDTGTLKRYIDELSVTGLTSNPTIFDHAIKNRSAYDAAIREKLAQGQSHRNRFHKISAIPESCQTVARDPIVVLSTSEVTLFQGRALARIPLMLPA